MGQDMFGAEASAVDDVVETLDVVVEATSAIEAPAEAPAEAIPPIAPVGPAKPEPGFVPIAAMLDERDNRKRLEAELAHYREQQAQPVALPDMFEDPEGFRAHQEQIIASHTLTVKLDVSEDVARDKFGDELVDKAREWALSQYATRPGFRQEVLGNRNPYRYVVEQYQREQIASKVTPDDFAQFQAWKAAQATLAQQQPAALAAPTNSVQMPPASIAGLPNAGGTAQPKPDPVAERLNQMF